MARLDRLARDLITQEVLLAEVRRRGADVISAAPGEQAYLTQDAADPSRKLIRQVLGAVAEYERALVVLRLQAGRRAKREAGGWAGGVPPYGKALHHGEFVPNPRERTAIAMARRLRAEGVSYQTIADRLNFAGLRPRRGRWWFRSNVRDVIFKGGQDAGPVKAAG